MEQPPQLEPSLQEQLELPVGLLNLTQVQISILQKMREEAKDRILLIQFNGKDTEEDAVKIRQHAYLYGALDNVSAILSYDEAVLEQTEAKLRNAESAPFHPHF